MWKNLLPKEHLFFDLFEQASGYSVEAAKLLLRMTENYADADLLAREIEAVEHACDEVTHKTMDRLNKSFITPIDREDIHAFIAKLDDVVDLIHATANRLAFFKIDKPTPHAVNLAKQVLRGCDKLTDAVHGMRSPKRYDAVQRDCIAINEVENAADDLLREALAQLFATEKDPIKVIKWKDIYEALERVTDCCEDAANVMQDIIVKMT
jgi:predicted phosphate transport protein (TIGR00153 family)